MTRIITALLLACFPFSNLCHSQQVQEFPQWLNPFVEDSHSILAQDEGILNRDFSAILADKRTEFLGYIGDNYYKMDMDYHSVEKESDREYRISGSSKVRSNTCPFSGSFQILDIRELNEYWYGVDNFMEGKIKKMGICIARYSLEEEEAENNSGVFSGFALFRWYIDDTYQLLYDDVNDCADSYANNQFAGVWRSHSTGREKKCAWGQYRIPDCGDLDMGAGEFSVDPAYRDNGWTAYMDSVGF